ncbi:unnamed protein product [Anisakis simplex]|uniref:Uncharacterized protein n=1 Tax=Anisakis simplex TaxID=6269 RepID=A0A0M3K5I8_ANISI|nr:unnamed protein product [Anisakis simplex]
MGSGSSAQAPRKRQSKSPAPPPPEESSEPKCDPRLPYPNFRELFTLKNYWKTVRRNEKECGKMIMVK